MLIQIRVFLFIVLFFASSLVVFGQFGNGGAKAIKKLQQTETIVILGYSEAYNDAIKEAFELHWSFTKVKFISGPQYKEYCSNSRYSFVHLFTIEDWQLSDEEYDDVGIALGGNCRTGPTDMIAYANMEVWDPTYYRLECKRAVQFMQTYLEMGLRENLPSENEVETTALYAKRQQEMHGKTLYFGKEDLMEEVRKVSEIQKYYTKDVQLEDQLSIDRAAWKETPDILYTTFVFDIEGYSYHLVIQAEGNQILYATPTKWSQGYLVGKKILRKFDDF